MVDKITLNGVLAEAILEKDVAARLTSAYPEVRARQWAKYEDKLDLTPKEKHDLLDFEPTDIRELLEFCAERFQVQGNPPRDKERS